MAVFTDFEILVGTYEEYVIGYKLVPQIKPSINYDLVQNFVVKAHLGPVRCITTGKNYQEKCLMNPHCLFPRFKVCHQRGQ